MRIGKLNRRRRRALLAGFVTVFLFASQNPMVVFAEDVTAGDGETGVTHSGDAGTVSANASDSDSSVSNTGYADTLRASVNGEGNASASNTGSVSSVIADVDGNGSATTTVSGGNVGDVWSAVQSNRSGDASVSVSGNVICSSNQDAVYVINNGSQCTNTITVNGNVTHSYTPGDPYYAINASNAGSYTNISITVNGSVDASGGSSAIRTDVESSVAEGDTTIYVDGNVSANAYGIYSEKAKKSIVTVTGDVSSATSNAINLTTSGSYNTVDYDIHGDVTSGGASAIYIDSTSSTMAGSFSIGGDVINNSSAADDSGYTIYVKNDSSPDIIVEGVVQNQATDGIVISNAAAATHTFAKDYIGNVSNVASKVNYLLDASLTGTNAAEGSVTFSIAKGNGSSNPSRTIESDETISENTYKVAVKGNEITVVVTVPQDSQIGSVTVGGVALNVSPTIDNNEYTYIYHVVTGADTSEYSNSGRVGYQFVANLIAKIEEETHQHSSSHKQSNGNGNQQNDVKTVGENVDVSDHVLKDVDDGIREAIAAGVATPDTRVQIPIQLNGNYEVPSEILKQAAGAPAKLNFTMNDGSSYNIDSSTLNGENDSYLKVREGSASELSAKTGHAVFSPEALAAIGATENAKTFQIRSGNTDITKKAELSVAMESLAPGELATLYVQADDGSLVAYATDSVGANGHASFRVQLLSMNCLVLPGGPGAMVQSNAPPT